MWSDLRVDESRAESWIHWFVNDDKVELKKTRHWAAADDEEIGPSKGRLVNEMIWRSSLDDDWTTEDLHVKDETSRLKNESTAEELKV